MGDFFTLVSMKLPYSYQKAKISLCKSVFFTNNHLFSSIFMLNVPEIWPIQGLIFNVLFQTCSLYPFLRLSMQHVCFMKGRTCGGVERNSNILLAFRKYTRISVTLPSSQLRENLSRPVFIKCGEPCITLLVLFRRLKADDYKSPIPNILDRNNKELSPYCLFLHLLKYKTRQMYSFLPLLIMCIVLIL